MRRLAVMGALLVGAALLLAGCGQSGSDGGRAGSESPPAATGATPAAALPQRPRGVVAIAGDTSGSLTPRVTQILGSSGAPLRLDVSNDGAATGFAALCAGQVDAVDSVRSIAPAESAACDRNGIGLVEFAVAADAVVLAIRNETDVGLDCLTLDQARAALGAGSRLANWRDLGGYRVPLKATGPPVSGSASGATIDLAGVLGGVAGVRADYRPQETNRAIRLSVVGTEEEIGAAALRGKAQRDLAALRRAIAQNRAFLRDATFQVNKGIRDGRPAEQQALDLARQTRAQAQVTALERSLPRALAFARRTAAALATVAGRRGVLAVLPFSYYELFEEQLRPMEIDAGAGALHDCIFPSAATVEDGTYPLAHRLLITVPLSGLKRPELRRVLRLYVDNSQRLAREARLIPPSDAQVRLQRAWLTGRTAPTLVSYGAPGGADTAP